jgi:hypothetical protein
VLDKEKTKIKFILNVFKKKKSKFLRKKEA